MVLLVNFVGKYSIEKHDFKCIQDTSMKRIDHLSALTVERDSLVKRISTVILFCTQERNHINVIFATNGNINIIQIDFSKL